MHADRIGYVRPSAVSEIHEAPQAPLVRAHELRVLTCVVVEHALIRGVMCNNVKLTRVREVTLNPRRFAVRQELLHDLVNVLGLVECDSTILTIDNLYA